MPYTSDPDAATERPVYQRDAVDGTELDALDPLDVVATGAAGSVTISTTTWVAAAEAADDGGGGYVRWLSIPLAGRPEGLHYLRAVVTGENDVDLGTVQMLGPA